MADLVLVADIGGTNARFALAEIVDGVVSIHDMRRLRAADFETVHAAAETYLKEVRARPERACFAAAGPVMDGVVDFTNSHWRLAADDICGPLNLRRLLVTNDFYALAAGVNQLAEGAFVEIKDGAPDAAAPRLVTGPGTGFGQALIAPTKSGAEIIATEGGHVSFAPHTDEEFEIRKFVARAYGRVSVDRLLSGPGIENIYRALCAFAGTPDKLRHAKMISAAAVEGADPIAVKTLNIFCGILGRVTGDAVLATGARGGVVLAGGILPEIKDFFSKSAFVDCFVDKGRLTSYVAAAPVRLIVADDAALYGAAALVATQPL